MKRKILLLTILLTGIIFSINAQEKESERARAEIRERVRAVARAAEPRVVVGSSGVENGVYFYGSEEQRVSLNLSKHFEGESISSDADFEVNKEHSSISLNLSGSCRSGNITITIIQPNGDIMKEQKITNAADISWSTRFSIKEGEEKKYIGKWKLIVDANKAEGHYSLNINSR